MSTKDDLTALLNAAVDVATDQLQARTEFLPFALAMKDEDGEIFHLEPDGDEDDDSEPDQAQVLATLRGGLHEDARDGKWRAVAICADVTIEDDAGEAVTSAIHVWLEHREDEPVDCAIPYDVAEDAVELSELAAQPGEPHVFRAREPAN